ncbi:hypothetical protein [Amaricoccus sp.]|uniref:hypothetical protein n=1 Tax=Amaricoccus sp. TaxID=1872485 RepID=UPI001B6D9256|nr:hypothetical protein [Amaricoccus sp.]MBP7000128.1 hypothetical protein [Amaricoccus sp.]
MRHNVPSRVHGGAGIVGSLVLGVGSGVLLAVVAIASGQGALYALLAYLLTGSLVSGALIVAPAARATARAARRHIRHHAHV